MRVKEIDCVAYLPASQLFMFSPLISNTRKKVVRKTGRCEELGISFPLQSIPFALKIKAALPPSHLTQALVDDVNRIIITIQLLARTTVWSLPSCLCEASPYLV